jgi:hypothetical protein
MVQGNNSESRAELTSWVLGCFLGQRFRCGGDYLKDGL